MREARFTWSQCYLLANVGSSRFEAPEVDAPYVNPFGLSWAAGDEVAVHIVEVNGQTVVVVHSFGMTWPEQGIPGYPDEEWPPRKNPPEP